MRVEPGDGARVPGRVGGVIDRASRRPGRGPLVALALGLAAAIIVADQLTKAAITARYGAACGSATFDPVLGRHAGFSYVCNTGTAFSMFRGASLVWIPVTIAIGAVLWLWLRSLAEPRPLQQFAFGLVIGGAIGNIIDRVRLGYVVDFVDLRINDQWRWYVFNVADAAICIGVALLAVAFWRTGEADRRAAAGGQRAEGRSA